MAPLLKMYLREARYLELMKQKEVYIQVQQNDNQIFHNSEINKGNAQLIFNTHDTNLLSLDLFRRDQIWFAEKDPKKGATELYPLDDFQ